MTTNFLRAVFAMILAVLFSVAAEAQPETLYPNDNEGLYQFLSSVGCDTGWLWKVASDNGMDTVADLHRMRADRPIRVDLDTCIEDPGPEIFGRSKRMIEEDVALTMQIRQARKTKLAEVLHETISATVPARSENVETAPAQPQPIVNESRPPDQNACNARCQVAEAKNTTLHDDLNAVNSRIAVMTHETWVRVLFYSLVSLVGILCGAIIVLAGWLYLKFRLFPRHVNYEATRRGLVEAEANLRLLEPKIVKLQAERDDLSGQLARAAAEFRNKISFEPTILVGAGDIAKTFYFQGAEPMRSQPGRFFGIFGCGCKDCVGLKGVPVAQGEESSLETLGKLLDHVKRSMGFSSSAGRSPLHV